MIATYALIGYILACVVVYVWPQSDEYQTKLILFMVGCTVGLGRWIEKGREENG